MSFKGSPSHDSMSSGGGGARLSMLTDDSSLLARDFSLTSIASASSTSASSQDEFFKSSDHAECTLRRMQNYLDNNQLCDVILVAGIDGRKYVNNLIYLLITCI